jgi:hypothetical protein
LLVVPAFYIVADKVKTNLIARFRRRKEQEAEA